jgi:hypothetical protein
VDSFLEIDRRRVLQYLSAMGATGIISSLLSGCAAKSIVPGLSSSSGAVFINGKAVTADEEKGSAGVLVAADATVTTGDSGVAVFVVGSDAFLLRENSRLKLLPNKNSVASNNGVVGNSEQISGFMLQSGALMSVFSPGVRKLRTPSAVVGIRGTGVYIEASQHMSYICTCYGTVKIDALDGAQNSEIITTTHHDSPRIIYADSGKIKKAPMVNHTDAELVLLEELVGRKPPFVGAFGIVSDSY